MAYVPNQRFVCRSFDLSPDIIAELPERARKSNLRVSEFVRRLLSQPLLHQNRGKKGQQGYMTDRPVTPAPQAAP